jgi:hypothetical protein
VSIRFLNWKNFISSAAPKGPNKGCGDGYGEWPLASKAACSYKERNPDPQDSDPSRE